MAEVAKQPFCECKFPDSADAILYRGDVHKLIDCTCGKTSGAGVPQWQWHREKGAHVIIDANNITFHPHYSQGTVIVRGNQTLDANMVHYWELRIVSALSGTDIMIGVGTERIELKKYAYKFVSALGKCNQSWGYSYRGMIQHSARMQKYGKNFTQGSLVGVFVDRVYGYIEFFLNRRSLGIAFKNIPNDPQLKLYPMLSSTSCKCALQLVNATSLPVSLEMRAFQTLNRHSALRKRINDMPGLQLIAQNYWFLPPEPRYSHCLLADQLDLLDEAVLPNKNKNKRRLKETTAYDYNADNHLFWIEERIRHDLFRLIQSNN